MSSTPPPVQGPRPGLQMGVGANPEVKVFQVRGDHEVGQGRGDFGDRLSTSSRQLFAPGASKWSDGEFFRLQQVRHASGPI
eukprot:1806373-Pyramimonas_sp.AAC.1